MCTIIIIEVALTFLALQDMSIFVNIKFKICIIKFKYMGFCYKINFLSLKLYLHCIHTLKPCL